MSESAAAATATPGAAPASTAAPAAPAATPAATPGAQPGAAPAATPATSTPTVVPERYDLKAPANAQLDAAFLERTAAEARALGLSQEAAQKYLEAKHGEIAKFQEAQLTQHAQRVQQWAEQTKNDPEIGGANFAQTSELAARVFDKYATPEFKKLVGEAGFGNHPELVRVFARIGKAISEDALALGNLGGGKKDAATVLYGGTQTNQ